MREVFFNSFKEKILNGQVPNMFDVHGTPVTSDFIDIFDNDEIKLEQYKTLDDFNKYANGNGTKTLEQTTFKYEEYGVEYSAYYNNDVSEKPMFVNPDNWEKFLQTYSGEIGYSDPKVKEKFDQYIYQSDENINSGFYYIQKKSQLKWISERCNDKDNFNNRIIVVMGDDIGNPAEGYQLLDTVICNDPNRPFQGILDFNGHRISNLIIKCKDNSNGIIGYLGADGLVRDAILNNIRFVCDNKISLDKIRNDCSDVVVGGLVGTNYGTVQNVITSGDMQFNGFCPEVYLSSNKYEYTPYDNVVNNTNYNCFFPSKFCINSLYNVIPYVGYFCEGADSYFNDIGDPRFRTPLGDNDDPSNDDVWNMKLWDITTNNIKALLGVRASNNDTNKILNYNFDHFSEVGLKRDSTIDTRTARLSDHIGIGQQPFGQNENTSDLHVYKQNSTFCDLYRIHKYTQIGGFDFKMSYPPMLSMEDDQNFSDLVLTNTITSLSNLSTWNDLQSHGVGDATTYIKADGDFNNERDYGIYLAKQIRSEIMLSLMTRYNQQVTVHQKMNPYSRIAYYCSPIVGSNFGTIENIDARHSIRETTDTFVGFIGNVCGKENCGAIRNVNSLLDIVEINDTENSVLKSRTYTDNRSFVPEYPSDYKNLVNVFGYNWDYYQSPYSLSEEESEIYSGSSASAARASDVFYTFHDLGKMGVQIVRDGNSWTTKNDKYVFNRLIDRVGGDISDAQRYCNFKLPGYESDDSATIGEAIPSSIRDAKLKMIIDSDSSNSILNDYSIRADIPVNAAIINSTFKLYNPYDADKSDNIYQPLQFNEETLSSSLNSIGDIIQHMDLDVIGDSCKYLSEEDPIGLLTEQYTKADGSKYQLTFSDLITYCSVYSGECGRTLNNAKEFAQNIMNAKVAIGCELLANPSMKSDYEFPGGTLPMGGYDYEPDPAPGLFGLRNEIHDGDYVIPAMTGPNDTPVPWVIDKTRIGRFCWFMQPGACQANTTFGPYAFDHDGSYMQPPKNDHHVYACVASGINESDTKIVEYNTDANRPNYFCSINERGFWDLYGTSACNDWDPRYNTPDLFNNGHNYFESGNPKTMIRIKPRDNDNRLKEFGRCIASVASLDQGFRSIISDQYEVLVNQISIPISNRTQNRVYMSSSFEGVIDTSGVYLDYRRQEDLYSVYIRQLDPQRKALLPRPVTDDDGKAECGNLDYMYVDMSIQVRDESREGLYRSYPMIAKIPIERLRVPISAVQKATPVITKNVERYSEDLANYVNGTVKIKERGVRYFHLTPAYDILNRTENTIQYKLKSIYNVGGICGMINHSVNFAERGNYKVYQENRDDPTYSSNFLNLNNAECGSISNCWIKISENTKRFIENTMLTNASGEVINDRTISIANKFAGVSPVYEYRQNDIGTSPWNGFLECGPDTLECLQSQPFRIRDVTVGGYEKFYTGAAPSEQQYYDRSLFRIFSKIFSPIIEWANIGNILDTTNFFLITDLASTGIRYRARQSSNFPESSNIHQAFSVDPNTFAYIGQNPEMNSYICGARHPVVKYGRNWIDEADGWNGWRKYVDQRRMIQTGSSYNDGIASGFYPRLHFSKTYHLLPSLLIDPIDVWIYGDYPVAIDFSIHMSPVTNSPCSEYNDIYMQMFSGNPNFVNRKLSKPILPASLHNRSCMNSLVRAERLDQFNLLDQNAILINTYENRLARSGGISDRYFTWDYDMKNVRDLDRDKMPLDFTIRYGKDKNGVRGLWIHQNDKYIEENPWIQYAMKGQKYCMNDGSNIHLGYLPSDWSIIELLNRENENDEDPNMQFEEGRAIDGDDFRGILLSDENRDLVAFIDGGYGRDLTSGCYIAQLPKKNKFDGDDKNYGLLTEIKVEN